MYNLHHAYTQKVAMKISGFYEPLTMGRRATECINIGMNVSS